MSTPAPTRAPTKADAAAAKRAAARAAQEAEALRANLHRRKQQSRTRHQSGAETAKTPDPQCR